MLPVPRHIYHFPKGECFVSIFIIIIIHKKKKQKKKQKRGEGNVRFKNYYLKKQIHFFFLSNLYLFLLFWYLTHFSLIHNIENKKRRQKTKHTHVLQLNIVLNCRQKRTQRHGFKAFNGDMFSSR
jgi:hypothetical protein